MKTFTTFISEAATETKLTASLLNKVKKVFPSLRKSAKMKGEFAIIEGIMDDTEANAMVKDINTIVRESFEGKIKDVEFAVVLDYNYMTFRAIKETARIV